MGNWQLEVAKMAVYMAFPVTSFYVYHQVLPCRHLHHHLHHPRHHHSYHHYYHLHRHNHRHQVDWFEDNLKDIHTKTRTRETIENDKEIKEYVEMMRTHR